ncbi:LOW QUALITY PROTEIN: Dimer_Tnp_hAT domain-containing protein, partial [Cephalotus follicularis]
AVEVARMIDTGELETGRGANQIGTLHRAGDTRCSSHLNSVTSLMRMFHATGVVLDNISVDGSNFTQLAKTFDENMVELLILSSALDPKYSFKSFSVDKICSLVPKFYHEDFTEQEQICLPYELQHYAVDIFQHPNFGSIFTLSELCQLAETGKTVIYLLVDRLIRIVLTLPISTVTIERAFLAMNIIKNKLRSKMEDDYLRSSLVLYIEREIAEKITTYAIIDDFCTIKERRV